VVENKLKFNARMLQVQKDLIINFRDNNKPLVEFIKKRKEFLGTQSQYKIDETDPTYLNDMENVKSY